MLDERVKRQREIKEKAIDALAETIKKETEKLEKAIGESHSEGKHQEVFEDKMASKLSWRSF
jgi:galactose-1-phosphate uridylyltransferase